MEEKPQFCQIKKISSPENSNFESISGEKISGKFAFLHEEDVYGRRGVVDVEPDVFPCVSRD